MYNKSYNINDSNGIFIYFIFFSLISVWIGLFQKHLDWSQISIQVPCCWLFHNFLVCFDDFPNFIFFADGFKWTTRSEFLYRVRQWM